MNGEDVVTGMLSALLLGFFVGMQHALEPDHLAAVASMISGKTSIKSMIKHGIAWGLGHTSTLLLVSAAVFVAGMGISGVVSRWLEFGVGLMLVGLGGHVIWRLHGERWHIHKHSHGSDQPHLHFHSHHGENAPHSLLRHDHSHAALPLRALAVGVMHGMAGSAALIVLTAAAFASLAAALTYVLIFGLGTVAGMALLTAGMAFPMSWSARAINPVYVGLQLAIGVATTSLGFFIVYDNSSYLTG